MKLFEAGIVDIIAPYNVYWTGETSFAATEHDAQIDFETRGFYRNLMVRESKSMLREVINDL